MFDRLVGRYDLLNDVLSMGMDRWWRRAALAAIDPRPEDLVLDVGCGTGALTAAMAARTAVVGLDVSPAMLDRARTRLRGRAGATLVQGSAFRLPFREGAFTAVTSAFVLRNLDDLPAAFGEMGRVSGPGARLALVDITEPSSRGLRRAFDAYFRIAAPTAGRLVGQADAYRYLVRSLAHLPPPEEMIRMLERAGFDQLRSRRLTGGIATLFSGRRTAVVG
jgi:demethylmenaquinone methyltransferase / 2-methoxy-6-polyprenyl-1,4-benzoquinol methylase